MNKVIGSFVIAVLILCTGTTSFAGVYQDNVLSGSLFRKDVNQEHVKKLATESGDIYSFIRKIYEPRKIWVDLRNSINVYQTGVPRINQIFSNTVESEDQFVAGIGENDFDRKIYAAYCSAKNGALFYWDNRLELIGYRFYVCEMNGKPESFQVIESSSAETAKPAVRHWFGYGDGNKFESISAKRFRYEDPSGKLIFSYLGGGRFWVKLNYVNTANRPTSVELSKYRVIQDGAEYEAEFSKKKSGTYFGQDSGYARLNPKQSINGESIITVRGLNYDGKPLVIMIDSLKYEGFIKKLDYAHFRKKLF